MERLKALSRRLFCLPLWLTAIISVPAFALVVYVLVYECEAWLTYAAYMLSAYALIISAAAAVRGVRAAKRDFYGLPAVKRLRANPIGEKLMDSADFRSEVSVYGGFAGNLFYSALNIAMGFIYGSAWHYSLVAYYLLLSLMRGYLSRCLRERGTERDVAAEYRAYRAVGFMLLFMNQALAGIVFYIVHKDMGSQYQGLTIYAAAAYTFYITILAIINVFRYRRRNSPILSAAKNISLTASLVSMLSLETAMLAAFSDEGSAFRRMMTASFGGAVCTIVLAMAIYMIVRANKFLKEDVQHGRQTGQL